MSSIIITLCIVGSVVVAEEKVCSSFCSSLGMLQSSPGKSCADIYQTNKASRGVSGLYWINTTSGLHQVNCDMELECGGHKGGWTTIVKFDISKGDPCPSGLTRIGVPPQGVCRSGNDDAGCHSIIYTTYNVSFNKICGQVKAYQKGGPGAFYNYVTADHKSINERYVDGISITLGNPRKHVWTYAMGLSDDGNFPQQNCPCAAIPGPDPPAFVGNHYFCESGATGHWNHNGYYWADPLWDGNGCHHARNNCCTNLDMPWFFRQFSSSKNDYIEARICRLHPFAFIDTLVESIELYVQ